VSFAPVASALGQKMEDNMRIFITFFNSGVFDLRSRSRCRNSSLIPVVRDLQAVWDHR
jgi:hypothetical protein